MSKALFLSIIQELGKNINLPDLKPDEDNYCCLGFDDKIVTHIQYNEENNIIMLFSQIGIVAKDKQAVIYPKLLKANLFWQGTGGATVGVDDETNEVVLCYQTTFYDFDFKKFEELLEGFVNTSELWMNTLDAVQKGIDGAVGDLGKL